MFRLIEAHGYRSLKSISQPLGSFEILVGANGSGKSTFLDVMRFWVRLSPRAWTLRLTSGRRTSTVSPGEGMATASKSRLRRSSQRASTFTTHKQLRF